MGFQGIDDDSIGGDIITKAIGWIKPDKPDFLVFDPEAKKTGYEDEGRTLHIAYPRLKDKVYVKLDDFGSAEALSENVGQKVNTQYAVTFMLAEEY
jgi:hypothetical protein